MKGDWTRKSHTPENKSLGGIRRGTYLQTSSEIMEHGRMLSSFGIQWFMAGLGRLETTRWDWRKADLAAALPGAVQVNRCVCWGWIVKGHAGTSRSNSLCLALPRVYKYPRQHTPPGSGGFWSRGCAIALMWSSSGLVAVSKNSFRRGFVNQIIFYLLLL